MSKKSSIPAQYLIALTPQGKPLKQQDLSSEVGLPAPELVQ